MICHWCKEEVEDNHESGIHEECGIRSLMGGVNHHLKQCHCFGGTMPNDPEGLTLRQAAKAAVAVWRVLG